MGLDNPLHILALLLIVALVFGAARLPAIGRTLGSGMRSLRERWVPLDEPAADATSPPEAVAPAPGVDLASHSRSGERQVLTLEA